MRLLSLVSAALLSVLPALPKTNAASPKIAAAMQEKIAAKEIPGAVTAVVTRDGIVHLQAVGEAGAPGSKPLRDDSLFWIASMTKPVTGTAILLLQEEGKLSVNDLVGKHIPEMANLKTPSGQPANLTLKHLMTHTSGLPEATEAEMKAAKTLTDLIPAYTNKPMQFEPGSKWQYCQSGINTLGRIVEITSGQPYERFLDSRLFKPLRMKDTTFYVRPNQVSRLVTPVKREQDGALTASTIRLLQGKPATATDRYPAANGGLFSTAPDYARFARMILNGGALEGRKYLSPDSIRQMTTVQTDELTTGFTPGNGWGLTWCVIRKPQEVSAMLSPGSYGHGGAYGTQAWIDPVKGFAYILMIQRSDIGNSDNSSIRLAFQQAATSQ